MRDKDLLKDPVANARPCAGASGSNASEGWAANRNLKACGQWGVVGHIAK